MIFANKHPSTSQLCNKVPQLRRDIFPLAKKLNHQKIKSALTYLKKSTKTTATYPNGSIPVWRILSTNTKPGFMRSGLPAQLDSRFQPIVDLVVNRALVFIAVHAAKINTSIRYCE